MKHAINEKKLLQQYKVLLEDWLPKNASIAIALNQTYIYFASGSHDLKLDLGSPVQTNSIAYRVLESNAKVDAVLDNSLFDTPYYGIGYPIIIDGECAALVIILPSSFTIPKHEPYRFLTGRQNDDWMPVPIQHISYIESLQKHTWFYENKEQYKTTITLKELETRLPDYFIRIHRSFIINIHFIKKISREITGNFIIILKDNTELPIGQSYTTNVRKALQF